MATAQNKWYSWGAAKRPRTQPQHECSMSTLGIQVDFGTQLLTGIRIGLRREVTGPKDPRAGFDEGFDITLSIDELERLFGFYKGMRAKYGGEKK